MREDPPAWLGYGMLAIIIACILFGIAITSGIFGGQSDIEVFKAYVEGGNQ